MGVEQLILDKLQQLSEPQRYAVLQYVEQLLDLPSVQSTLNFEQATDSALKKNIELYKKLAL